MKLFISYRSTNSNQVDTLVSRLRSLKDARSAPLYTLWQDKDSIPAGKDWWVAIVDAIIDCEVFLFMVSHESVQSINCLAELNYARKRNRAILPIVLEGEFTYNAVSGKYDLDYWKHIPPDLNAYRTQFLFYEGVSFIKQLETAIEEFRRNPRLDTPAPRPPDPRPGADTNIDSTTLYDEACDYALRMEFETADRLFRRLITANDPDFGSDAHEWILILTDYAQMVRWDEHENTRYRVQSKWETYRKQFPKPFTPLYDPQNLRARFDSASGSGTPAPKRPTSREVLPAPFDWVSIPAGKVTLKEGGYLASDTTFEVPAFSIAKYPLTNAQFAKFIEAGGYRERRWWTDAGWQKREANSWTQPEFWTNKRWNPPQCPVVGVSWYEAIAFCLWLKEVTGETISLPTEQQWQRAAQGDDNRDYPWGTQWDKNRCHNDVARFSLKLRTAPVTQYEGKGDSPFGVVDMAGNVLESCLTAYETGSNDLAETSGRVLRGLRGGSWSDISTYLFRCDCRRWGDPDIRDYLRGYRLARA